MLAKLFWRDRHERFRHLPDNVRREYTRRIKTALNSCIPFLVWHSLLDRHKKQVRFETGVIRGRLAIKCFGPSLAVVRVKIGRIWPGSGTPSLLLSFDRRQEPGNGFIRLINVAVLCPLNAIFVNSSQKVWIRSPISQLVCGNPDVIRDNAHLNLATKVCLSAAAPTRATRSSPFNYRWRLGGSRIMS